MMRSSLSDGTVHKMPADLRKALLAKKSARERWESLTPLARNEWICWTVSPKQADTRKNHVERTVSELLEGKRRPCCWMGCIHRTDKSVSPSVKWVMSKRNRSS